MGALYQAVYLLTGVLQTIVYQILVYHGAGEKTTMLPLLARFLGVASAVMLPKDQQGVKHPKKDTQWTIHTYTLLLFFACLNLTATVLMLTALFYSGSGLFQVVYASGIITTAIVSWIWTKKSLSQQQWMAIAVVWIGLVFSALGAAENASLHGSDEAAKQHSEQEHGHQLLGIALTLIACLIWSFHNVFCEIQFGKEKSPITPTVVQSFSGVFCLCMTTLYVLMYTLPRWNELVSESVQLHNGDAAVIIAMFLVMSVASFLHDISFYFLLGSVGAVSTGIIQCLRAVLVFIISSWLFCSAFPEQCFNVFKGISAILVSFGVLYFSFQSSRSKKRVYAVDKMNQEELIA